MARKMNDLFFDIKHASQRASLNASHLSDGIRRSGPQYRGSGVMEVEY